MAPKKQEATLTDIFTVLVEIKTILAKPETKIETPPDSPEGDPSDTDVPKFLREYLEKNPDAGAADLIREFKVSQNKALAAIKQFGKPLSQRSAPTKEEKPKKEKVTVEMLRGIISIFAERFGMNEALKINEEIGGSRKVSGIPEEKYEAIFNAMNARTSAAEAKPEEEGEEPVPVTKEDVQRVGAAFIGKYGDPAFRELLAKYVAKGDEAKISKVDPAKYRALHEALVNA